MYPDLQGKVAVVTGGSSGIGAAIVKRLAEEGVRVVINYLSDKQEAEALLREIDGNGIVVQGDVSVENDASGLIQAAIRQYGHLDILVNNAGVESQCPTHKLSLAEWNKIIDINLTGYFITCRDAISYFIEHNVKGTIINMSSVHEIIPWSTFTSYAASKGGVRMLTQSLAMEYAPYGIRINNIGPGAIETPINTEKLNDPEKRRMLEEMIPMQRTGLPHEIAAATAWLASGQAEYITGITLFIDGGMTLYPSFQGGQG